MCIRDSTYDDWKTEDAITLTGESAKEKTASISSDYDAIGVNKDNWEEVFTGGSTASSAMYTMDVTADTVLKGSVAVNFQAATTNGAMVETPRGESRSAVDHDSAVDPAALDHDNYVGAAATGETVWQYAPTFTTVSGGEGVFGPIRDGMKRMARTTRVLREAPVACAAKTGSPQLADTLPGGGHYVNSVLIGYAPADDPQIAMAVVLEYGGGGSNAAPILRAVLDAVFGV